MLCSRTSDTKSVSFWYFDFLTGWCSTHTNGFPTHSDGKQSVTVSFWGVMNSFFIFLEFGDIYPWVPGFGFKMAVFSIFSAKRNTLLNMPFELFNTFIINKIQCKYSYFFGLCI